MSEVTRENLDTSLVRQSRVAYDIIEAVFNHVGECWDALTMREIFDAREIIITGCGDSYCAALAAKPLFPRAQQPFHTDRVHVLTLLVCHFALLYDIF